MADEAFVTQGLSASVVAQRAGFYAGGSWAKKGGDAMLRISVALHGLVTSLVEEFGDVENILQQATAIGMVNGSPGDIQTCGSVESMPEHLPLVVAGILKKMVGTLVSDIKANAKIQKLLPAMQKTSGANHHAFFQDLMIPKNPSSSLNILPPGEEI